MTTVAIGHRTYKYSDEKAQDLLSKASKKVSKGVYAIEDVRHKYLRLVNMPMSTTQIKKMRRANKGLKIHANY